MTSISSRRYFVGATCNLTEEEMKDFFESRFGNCTFGLKFFDIHKTKSRKFGFLEFKNDVDPSIIGSHLIGNVIVKVKKIVHRSDEDNEVESCRRLFVGRLSEFTTESSLVSYCSQYGKVSDCYFSNQNYAFVTFEDIENALKFCQASEHIIDGKLINFSSADKRSRKRLESENHLSSLNNSQLAFMKSSKVLLGDSTHLNVDPFSIQKIEDKSRNRLIENDFLLPAVSPPTSPLHFTNFLDSISSDIIDSKPLSGSFASNKSHELTLGISSESPTKFNQIQNEKSKTFNTTTTSKDNNQSQSHFINKHSKINVKHPFSKALVNDDHHLPNQLFSNKISQTTLSDSDLKNNTALYNNISQRQKHQSQIYDAQFCLSNLNKTESTNGISYQTIVPFSDIVDLAHPSSVLAPPTRNEIYNKNKRALPNLSIFNIPSVTNDIFHYSDNTDDNNNNIINNSNNNNINNKNNKNRKHRINRFNPSCTNFEAKNHFIHGIDKKRTSDHHKMSRYNVFNSNYMPPLHFHKNRQILLSTVSDGLPTAHENINSATTHRSINQSDSSNNNNNNNNINNNNINSNKSLTFDNKSQHGCEKNEIFLSRHLPDNINHKINIHGTSSFMDNENLQNAFKSSQQQHMHIITNPHQLEFSSNYSQEEIDLLNNRSDEIEMNNSFHQNQILHHNNKNNTNIRTSIHSNKNKNHNNNNSTHATNHNNKNSNNDNKLRFHFQEQCTNFQSISNPFHSTQKQNQLHQILQKNQYNVVPEAFYQQYPPSSSIVDNALQMSSNKCGISTHEPISIETSNMLNSNINNNNNINNDNNKQHTSSIHSSFPISPLASFHTARTQTVAVGRGDRECEGMNERTKSVSSVTILPFRPESDSEDDIEEGKQSGEIPSFNSTYATSNGLLNQTAGIQDQMNHCFNNNNNSNISLDHGGGDEDHTQRSRFNDEMLMMLLSRESSLAFNNGSINNNSSCTLNRGDQSNDRRNVNCSHFEKKNDINNRKIDECFINPNNFIVDHHHHHMQTNNLPPNPDGTLSCSEISSLPSISLSQPHHQQQQCYSLENIFSLRSNADSTSNRNFPFGFPGFSAISSSTNNNNSNNINTNSNNNFLNQFEPSNDPPTSPSLILSHPSSSNYHVDQPRTIESYIQSGHSSSLSNNINNCNKININNKNKNFRVQNNINNSIQNNNFFVIDSRNNLEVTVKHQPENEAFAADDDISLTNNNNINNNINNNNNNNNNSSKKKKNNSNSAHLTNSAAKFSNVNINNFNNSCISNLSPSFVNSNECQQSMPYSPSSTSTFAPSVSKATVWDVASASTNNISIPNGQNYVFNNQNNSAMNNKRHHNPNSNTNQHYSSSVLNNNISSGNNNNINNNNNFNNIIISNNMNNSNISNRSYEINNPSFIAGGGISIDDSSSSRRLWSFRSNTTGVSFNHNIIVQQQIQNNNNNSNNQNNNYQNNYQANINTSNNININSNINNTNSNNNTMINKGLSNVPYSHISSNSTINGGTLPTHNNILQQQISNNQNSVFGRSFSPSSSSMIITSPQAVFSFEHGTNAAKNTNANNMKNNSMITAGSSRFAFQFPFAQFNNIHNSSSNNNNTDILDLTNLDASLNSLSPPLARKDLRLNEDSEKSRTL